jgi:hypothetical protein
LRGLVLGILLCAASAVAQRAPFGLGTDLRLEGIVDPSPTAEQQALGTIKIRGGNMARKFAVIRAQTSQTEGMSLFNRSELNPEQLLLYGNAALLDVFRNAPAGTRLRMLGRYQADDYILAEIVPVDPPTTPGPTPPK